MQSTEPSTSPPGVSSPARDGPSLDEERVVVERLQQGDRTAAAQLYQWYGERLYRAAILPRLPVPELAEDVLKDTFRLTMERIDQFRITDRSIYFWMRRIAVNRAIDLHRKRQRHKAIHDRHSTEETVDLTMGAQPAAPDRRHDQQQLKQQVALSLSRMNPRYALALKLRILEDRDREECARIMDVKLGTFDVVLHRAMKAFRKVYPPT